MRVGVRDSLACDPRQRITFSSFTGCRGAVKPNGIVQGSFDLLPFNQDEPSSSKLRLISVV